MARNCEKHFVGLNRVFLEEQWKRDKERKRPPLNTLTTADEVRQWIPSIKKDLNYYLNQLSGVRKHNYQESKMKEFEKKVKQLEKEHKMYVKKVHELEPDYKGIPWEPKPYIRNTKRPLKNDDSCSSMSKSSSVKRKKIVLNVLKDEHKGDG